VAEVGGLGYNFGLVTQLARPGDPASGRRDGRKFMIALAERPRQGSVVAARKPCHLNLKRPSAINPESVGWRSGNS
jgi:hypothetical protein